MFYKLSLVVVAFLSLLAAIRGETWNASAAGLRKVTRSGWILIVLGLVAAGLSTISEIQQQSREKAAALDEKKREERLLSAVSAPPTPLEELSRLAGEACWSLKFDKALEYYSRLLAADPQNSEEWLRKAFCHLSQEYKKPMAIGPMWLVADFHRPVPTESKNLDYAYKCAQNALTSARNDLETLEANVAIALILLSKGTNCDHGGPGGMHGTSCPQESPAQYFVAALRLEVLSGDFLCS